MEEAILLSGDLISHLYEDRLAERTAYIEKKRAARKENSTPESILNYRESLKPLLFEMVDKKKTFQEIAFRLQREGWHTPKQARQKDKPGKTSGGYSWSPSMVYRMCCITGVINRPPPASRKKREKGEVLKYIDEQKYAEGGGVEIAVVPKLQQKAADEWFIDRWSNDLAYHDALSIASLITLMGRHPNSTYATLSEILIGYGIQRPISGTAIKKWKKNKTQWTIGSIHVLIRKYNLYREKEAPVPQIAAELNRFKGETYHGSASAV